VVLLSLSVKTFIRTTPYNNELSFAHTAIKEAPGYYLLYFRVADILANQGFYKEALPYYNKAYFLRGKVEKICANRAYCNLQLNNYKEAIEDYKCAVSFGKYHYEYPLNLIQCYYNVGDYENAMKELFVLKTNSPENVPAGLEEKISVKIVATELRQINDSILANPKDAAWLNERARYYYEHGMLQQSADDLKQVINFAPNDQSYKDNLKIVLEQLQATGR
jgi:tetratricopeptide (TPR) repeat protein